MILKWHLVEVSCSHTTVAVGGQTAIPQLENLRKSRVPFFVNKHSTETRCRASSVTMRVGQRITAIKNRKLAEHRKQNLLTDKSECKCLKSTRFNSCTALKWSTKDWTCARFDADHFGRYRMFSRGKGESESKIFNVTLSDDHTLTDV